MSTKNANTTKLKKILHSGFSGTLLNGLQNKILLDFHILDNGVVYYRFYSHHAKCEGTEELLIETFENEFKINLKLFLK